jgi:hypothetical protein
LLFFKRLASAGGAGRGEGAELAHRLRVAGGRDRYEMAVLSAVDPCRVGLDAFEQRD